MILWRIDYKLDNGSMRLAAICPHADQALMMTRHANECELTNRYELSQSGFWDAIFALIANAFKDIPDSYDRPMFGS